MTRGEEIDTAIERHDAAALRKLAKGVRKQETRMLLNLLAGMIDHHPPKAAQFKRTAYSRGQQDKRIRVAGL